MTNVVQIGRYEYIHVLNENDVTTRLEIGPNTFVKKAHEKIVKHCTRMIEVPKRHYCRIKNPITYEGGKPVFIFGGS